MKPIRLPRLTFWSAAFWTVMALGIVATILRFTQGLGAATNLSDEFPWGLWIGFDILCGVGLAAGGFVVAGAVYIFNLERYKPILRPAVLTAFLGYLLVIFALMYDLGRPWNVWHVMIMWNPRSVMFEVGWCVILYTAVLALEFSPIVFERLNLKRLRRVLQTITIPLVILGVILSSLHQSSLGSLFLIVPEKVYPLWYSSNLPYFFFLSAVAVGPAMVIIESFLSSRAFNREIELPILSQIARVSGVALAIYLVLKIQDVIAYHLGSYLFTLNLEGLLYWAEILLGVVTPIVLIALPKIRYNKRGLFAVGLLVVLGFILNRLNISMTAIERYSGTSYFPSWMEISVTLMVVPRTIHFVTRMLKVGGADGYAQAVGSATCLGCHAATVKTTATAAAQGVRVSHKEPLAAGADCTDCHKVYSGMVSSQTVGMTPCLKCHDGQTASAKCTACHIKDIATAAVPNPERPITGRDLIETPNCYACHKTQSCDNCHGIRMPHTKEFELHGHARIAAMDIWFGSGGQKCFKCHTATRNPCTKCHLGMMPSHGAGPFWAKDHQYASPKGCSVGCHGYMTGAGTSRTMCEFCHAPGIKPLSRPASATATPSAQ